MIPIAEVRQRVHSRITAAKQAAVERRAATDSASREFDEFLAQVAVPVFQMVAAVLTAERYPFTVSTPADRVQLQGRSPMDVIELELDTSVHPPVVLGRATHARGRRTDSVERPIRAEVSIAQLSDEDVLEFLLVELGRFVER